MKMYITQSGNPAVVLILAAAAGLSGCSQSHTAETDSGGGNRPMVAQSAVESSLAQGASELAFFDDLESRPLASQDDAIHAVLLLGTGTSAAAYEQRVAMAKELGYIPRVYNRPGHQAVTLGEVSMMIVRVLEGHRPPLEEDAIAKLAQRGIAPATSRANQGLTGAQLVSMVGGTRDAMAVEGVQKSQAPIIPEPVKPAAPAVATALPTPAPAPASPPPAPPAVAASSEPAPAPQPVAAAPAAPQPAPAATAQAPHPAAAATEPAPLTTKSVTLGEAARESAAPSAAPSKPETAPAAVQVESKPTTPNPAAATQGRTEPLPEIPVGTPPPAIDLQDPNSKPAVIGPDQRVIMPGQPQKGPAPKVDPAAKPKPADATKTVKPEPKPESKAEPKKDGKSAAREPLDPRSDIQPELSKDELKKLPKNGWVTGQPLKKSKTASAEDNK